MVAAAASSKRPGANRAHRDVKTTYNVSPATSSTFHLPELTQSHGTATRAPKRRALPYHPYEAAIGDNISPSPAPLFDPNERALPNCEYMNNYIQVFFNHHIKFPFLAYDDVIRRFLQQELPALLANCIAAHAAPIQHPNIAQEEQRQRCMRIADQYCATAKVWLSGTAQRLIR